MRINVTGSEKQIAWAQSIVDEVFAQLDAFDRAPSMSAIGYISVGAIGVYDRDDVAAVRTQCEAGFAALKTASQIIDNRARWSFNGLERACCYAHEHKEKRKSRTQKECEGM